LLSSVLRHCCKCSLLARVSGDRQWQSSVTGRTIPESLVTDNGRAHLLARVSGDGQWQSSVTSRTIVSCSAVFWGILLSSVLGHCRKYSLLARVSGDRQWQSSVTSRAIVSCSAVFWGITMAELSNRQDNRQLLSSVLGHVCKCNLLARDSGDGELQSSVTGRTRTHRRVAYCYFRNSEAGKSST
ncbi:hypothetical protein J6590_086820, partial [Homalodisca vitripennis]